MKHNFLRRLSALALALVMAVSLCVTPAWAASLPVRDPKLSTQIIVLPTNEDTPSPLTVSGLAPGDKVTWSVPNGVELSANGVTLSGSSPETTAEDDGSGGGISTVSVKAATSSSERVITASIKELNDDGTYTPTRVLRCYVYRGSLPFQEPQTLPNVSVDDTIDLEIRDFDHLDIFEPAFDANTPPTISFSQPDTSIAFVGAPKYDSTRKVLSVPIQGRKAGTIIITMAVTGGYHQEWSLTVVPDVAVPVTNVMVKPTTLEMTSGDTYTGLTVTIVPSNATNKAVKWSAENVVGTNVVEVDETTGKLTAKSAGKAIVTATPADGRGGKPGSCTVTVKESKSDMTLDPTLMVLDRRTTGSQGSQTGTIKPTLTGANRDNVDIKWTISPTTVADFGASGASTTTRNDASVTVYAKKSGSATVTAEAVFKDSTGKTTATIRKTCSVSVLDENSNYLTAITLNKNEHTMPEGASFRLSVTSYTPSNAPAKEVKWESSNPNVVDVKDGLVTAVGPGQTVVTATAVFGDKASDFCVVTVTQKSETIRLSGTFDSTTSGNRYAYTFGRSGNDTLRVTAVLGPSTTAYPPADPIHWSSANDAVATVSGGNGKTAVITAKGPGRTTITAVPMDHEGKDRDKVDPAVVTVTVSGITIVNDDAISLNSLTLMEGQRRQIGSQAYGTANTGDSACDWTSSDSSVVTVSPKNGSSVTLTARRAGTATITATKGTYVVTCSVTVTEDTAGVIEGISTTPGTAYQFSNITSRLQSACSSKTGSSLAYITNLSVSSTDQGILHDQHHSSADTGAGVGIQDRYYPGTPPQGQRSLNDLSFVPRNNFSGVAEINYTAWSTNNQSVNGIIRINVNGTGDVMYASGEGSPVTFLADDFNQHHPNFRSVSFTPPLDSRGTLYYGYSSASQPGTKVTASDSYNRTGTPSVDRVTFVPAAGYTGTVSISYRGTDTSGRSFTGTVTITVGGGGQTSAPGDIYYPSREDSWVTFRPSDFSNASRSVLGETLSYVRFELPPSSEGTLFYNYRGFGNYDSAVANTTSYYYSGTPSLGGVTFVPTTTTPSQVDISYTGYTTRGNTFTGTIHIGQVDDAQRGGLRYTVFTGKSVNFSAADFNTACVAATGASLSYVQFAPLPAVAQGTLRYTWTNSSTTYNLSTSTRCFYSTSGTGNVQLNNVSFLANSSYTGTVTIPFTGYNTNNSSFTGEVVISVTPPTSGDSVYYGTTASPLRLSSIRIRSACSDVLSGTLSYITFTSLPSSNAGKLYQDYSRFGTGTPVHTGTRYYVSGSGFPTIDQVSFVPRGRYNGQVTVGYTATNTSGQSVTGIITFNISNTGSSSYFSDMGYHAWAAPAVDYLYQNQVTNGVTATTFGPDQHILRCDFILMLCRAFHFSGGSGYSFADVPTNAYYADAVATAKQLGIVNGDGVNFMPNSELTRQDAMVMIKNALDAAGWNVPNASTSILGRFPDGTAVASYARNAVSTLVQMGAVNGDNGMLYPYNPITRAEAAVILHFVMTM